MAQWVWGKYDGEIREYNFYPAHSGYIVSFECHLSIVIHSEADVIPKRSEREYPNEPHCY